MKMRHSRCRLRPSLCLPLPIGRQDKPGLAMCQLVESGEILLPFRDQVPVSDGTNVK